MPAPSEDASSADLPWPGDLGLAAAVAAITFPGGPPQRAPSATRFLNARPGRLVGARQAFAVPSCWRGPTSLYNRVPSYSVIRGIPGTVITLSDGSSGQANRSRTFDSESTVQVFHAGTVILLGVARSVVRGPCCLAWQFRGAAPRHRFSLYVALLSSGGATRPFAAPLSPPALSARLRDTLSVKGK